MKHAIAILAIIASTLWGVCVLDAQTADRLVAGVEEHHQDGRQDRNDAKVKLYEHPLKLDYPELFGPSPVIVAFQADWCYWCKRQSHELRQRAGGHKVVYAELKYTPGDDPVQSGRWDKLLFDKWRIPDSVYTLPVTVIVCDGDIVHTFRGFKDWRHIQSVIQRHQR